jgi:energy-coupling factor transport system permease protein
MDINNANNTIAVGPQGHLFFALWMIALVLLTPARLFFLTVLVVFSLLVICYPAVLRRIMRPYLLLMIFLFALPAVIVGETDWWMWGLIPFSMSGALLGLKMSLRALIILIAVTGFTSSVSISTIAGVFERAGLCGLGFTLGVALNLLPNLRLSALHAWHSMKMRGGLRCRRWRGMQMFFITVISNALRRSEEIALAAEARAFTPDKSRALPIPKGRYDLLLLTAAILSTLFLAICG